MPADFYPVRTDETVRLVIRRHVHLDDMRALLFGALQFLHQQRDTGVLHDQHVRLVIDQGGQRLQHRRRVVVGITDDVFHPVVVGLGVDHPFPFVLQRHPKRDRQEGDCLALHRLVVVGPKFPRGLGPRLLRARDRRDRKNGARLRQACF